MNKQSINLRFPQEVYDEIKHYAEKDYIPTATWLKQIVMRKLEKLKENE